MRQADVAVELQYKGWRRFSLGMHAQPLRTQLLLLMLCALLPGLLAWAFYLHSERTAAYERAYSQARLIAERISQDFDGALRDYEVVLAELAARPRVKALDARRCDPLIKEYPELHPELTNITVRDVNGKLVCSSLKNAIKQLPPDQVALAAQAMRENRLFVTDVIIGAPNNRVITALAYPVRNDDGEAVGIVIAPLNLLVYNQRLLSEVDKSTIVTILDRKLHIAMRDHELEKWIRKPLPKSIIDIFKDGPEGYNQVTDLDGIARIGAYVTVPRAGYIVAVGLPKAQVLASYHTALIQSILIGVSVILLLLAIIWWLAERISDPVRVLAQTAQAVASGDGTIRARVSGPLEIRNVALEFNRMLDAISRHQEEREALTRHVQTLMRDARDIILLVDDRGAIFDANDAAVANYGHTLDELRSMRMNDLRDGANAAPFQSSWEMAASAEGVQFEDMHSRKDGSLFPVEISSRVLEIEGKRYMQSLVRDVSERKRLEAARANSQRMESLGTLAGGIAHDFNNILAAIRGNANLAAEDAGDNRDLALSIEEIRKASNRGAALVRRIMAFGRPKEPNRERVALGSVIEEVTKLLRSTVPANINLQTSFATGILPVLADAAEVHEALVNLTTNASYAIGTQPGSIEYRLKVVDIEPRAAMRLDMAAGRYACLSVQDSGCGMNEATRARAFDAFYTTKPIGEGTGLGLSMVHGIMKTHGGAVSIDSAPGAGSTFHLYFPAGAEARREMPPGPMPEAAASNSVPSAGRSVLYVDDDRALVSVAKRVLERLGNRVFDFTNPAVALRAFQANPYQYDIVVTDLSMPKLSGIDLAREIRAVRPAIPVIMISGSIRPEDERLAGEAGICRLILKPFALEELANAIEELFSASSLHK